MSARSSDPHGSLHARGHPTPAAPTTPLYFAGNDQPTADANGPGPQRAGLGGLARVGPYAIVGPLGEGGMGAVYRARHLHLGVERAIKVLLAEPDPGKLARFEREVANLAQVRHPNVVGVHEVGCEAGRPWMAMDLVEGSDLSAALRGGRPTLERALELAVGIARGVAALHRLGIVHRDLKPQNVVIAADGRPVVLDLGLAVAPDRDERLTQTGAALGTIGYMAPEQLAGQAGPATDVYALGLITYELVTGLSSIPAASSHQELVGKVLHRAPLEPGRVDASLPARLDRVCARATAPDPAARYPDAGALADALEAVRGAPGPSRRAVRRRALALLLPLGAGALAVALWLGAGADASQAAAPPPERPAAGGASRPERRPRALSRREVSQADDRLRELVLLGARRRVEALEEWLARYPGHPSTERARAALADARLELPLAVLTHEGASVAAFCRAGLVTGGADGELVLWDVARGEPLRTWETGWPVHALTTSADGARLLAGGPGGYAWFEVEGEGGEKLPIDFTVRAVVFLAEGDALVGGTSQWLRRRELPGGREVRTYGQINAETIGLGLLSDGTAFASINAVSAKSTSPFDNQVHCWEVRSGDHLYSLPLPERPSALAVSPDQDTFAVGTERGLLLLFSLEARSEKATLRAPGAEQAHEGPVRALAFAPDGQTLYSCGGRVSPLQTRVLAAWSVATGERLRAREALDAVPIHLSVAGDGQTLALVGEEVGRVEVWRADTWGPR